MLRSFPPRVRSRVRAHPPPSPPNKRLVENRHFFTLFLRLFKRPKPTPNMFPLYRLLTP